MTEQQQAPHGDDLVDRGSGDLDPAEQEVVDQQDPADDETPETGNAEAAKYRRRLRDTEAQRDTVSERLAGYQRREAERIAGEQLSKPGDLFDIGRVELADLLDDGGNVVPELVETALLGVLEERPQLAKSFGVRRGPNTFGLGAREGSIGGSPKPSWSDVIGGAKRR